MEYMYFVCVLTALEIVDDLSDRTLCYCKNVLSKDYIDLVQTQKHTLDIFERKKKLNSHYTSFSSLYLYKYAWLHSAAVLSKNAHVH